MKKYIRTAKWISLIFVIVLVERFYPELPNNMAVKFDMSGNPKKWGEKLHYIVIFGAMVLSFNFIIFSGPLLRLCKLNPKWVNIPYKDHWIQDDRHWNLAMEKLEIFFYLVCTWSNLIFAASWFLSVQGHVDLKFKLPIELFIFFVVGGSVLLLPGVYLYFRPRSS